MPAVIQRVDRVTGGYQAADDIHVPATMLAKAMHDDERGAWRALGQPALICQLHLPSPAKGARAVIHIRAPLPLCRTHTPCQCHAPVRDAILSPGGLPGE